MIAATKWYDLVRKVCLDNELLDKLWGEISLNYSSTSRYYHNIEHINRMLDSYDRWQNLLVKKEIVLLAIIYHDVIYEPQRNDNEEQSALFAKKQLSKTGFTSSFIEECGKYIVATKAHEADGADSDLNYLLDFDLEILGSPWGDYKNYTEQIRKEYKMYPDFLYKKGRIKVLKHFLGLKSIYKTEDFVNQNEIKARENIEKELKLYLQKK